MTTWKADIQKSNMSLIINFPLQAMLRKQGVQQPGKPGILREFDLLQGKHGKPGKLWEFFCLSMRIF